MEWPCTHATSGWHTRTRVEFTVDDEGLRAVDVLAATYARRNSGTLELTLADAVHETVAATRLVPAAE